MVFDRSCLGLWTEHSFGLFEQRLHRQRRQELSGKGPRRALFAATSQVTPDSQGRFVIPERLRQAAGLESDVVVIGNIDHLEIWDQGAWGPVISDDTEMLRLELETYGGPDPDDVW